MTIRLLLRYGDSRYFQASADNFCDITERHTFFSDRVIPGASRMFFKRKAVEVRGIEHVHSSPAVEPLTDVCRNAFLLHQGDQAGNEPIFRVS